MSSPRGSTRPSRAQSSRVAKVWHSNRIGEAWLAFELHAEPPDSAAPPHAEPAPSRQTSAQGSMPRGQKPQGHPVPARDRSQVTDSFDDTTGGPGPSTHRERRQPTRGTGPSCLLCIWFPPSGPCQGLPGLHFFDLMVKALRSIILCFAWQCRRTYL